MRRDDLVKRIEKFGRGQTTRICHDLHAKHVGPLLTINRVTGTSDASAATSI